MKAKTLRTLFRLPAQRACNLMQLLFVVRKAFGVDGWFLNISLRRAENDVVVFLIFDRK